MRFPCSCTPQGTSSGFWIVVIVVVLLTLLVTSAMERKKDEVEETEEGNAAIDNHGWLITLATIDSLLLAVCCLLIGEKRCSSFIVSSILS